MSQHDMDLANQAGAAFRADLNNALLALVSHSSGATAPATTFAYMFWADTTAGLLKMRNGANTGWISLGSLASNYLGAEQSTNKDASGGYPGLTGQTINLWNAAKTFMVKLATSATGNWTHTFPNRSGTIADNTDLALKAPIDNPTFTTGVTVPVITVNGGVNSSINMVDSDEGMRILHCNSNRIGFLNQSGGWGAYCNDDGSFASDTYMTAPTMYANTRPQKVNDTTLATTQYVDRNGSFFTQTSQTFVTPVAGFYWVFVHGGGGAGNTAGYAANAGNVAQTLTPVYLAAGVSITLTIGAGGVYSGGSGGTTSAVGGGISLSGTGGVTDGGRLYADGEDAAAPWSTTRATWSNTGGDYDNNEGNLKDGRYGGGGCWNNGGGSGTGSGGTGYVAIKWNVGPNAV